MYAATPKSTHRIPHSWPLSVAQSSRSLRIGCSKNVVITSFGVQVPYLAETEPHIGDLFSISVDRSDNGNRFIRLSTNHRRSLTSINYYRKKTIAHQNSNLAFATTDSDWLHWIWLSVPSINQKVSTILVHYRRLRSCFSFLLVCGQTNTKTSHLEHLSLDDNQHFTSDHNLRRVPRRNNIPRVRANTGSRSKKPHN